MRSSDALDKIAPALAAAQRDAGLVGKGGENKHDKYRYSDLTDFWLACKPVLDKHGLSIVKSSQATVAAFGTTETRNGGTQHIRHVTLTARIMHASGQWIEIDMPGEGHDRADKGIYKAVTGARKYALASLLNLATSDDPEADEGLLREIDAPQRPAEDPKPAAGTKKSVSAKSGLKQKAKADADGKPVGSPWTPENVAVLQAALEERGLEFSDLVASMKKSGLDVPDRVSKWPEEFKPRVKKWLESQPVLENEGEEESEEPVVEYDEE